MQAAKAEVAHMSDRCYGVVRVDLVKGFEKVPQDKLAAAATRRGYPLWLLRLSLDTYRMARVVVIDGACSRKKSQPKGLRLDLASQLTNYGACSWMSWTKLNSNCLRQLAKCASMISLLKSKAQGAGRQAS